MNSRLNNIFTETDCLSPEILSAYAENRLSNEDRYLVEKHLTDCELCSDALEGISQVKNKSGLKNIFTGLQQEIDKRTLKKERKVLHVNFRMRLAAAAILITIIGVTLVFRYYLGDQKKNMMAERTIKESELTKQEKESAKNEIKEITGGDASFKSPDNSLEEQGQSDVTIADAEKSDKDLNNKDIPYMIPKGIVVADQQKDLKKETFAGFYWNATTKAEMANEENEKQFEQTDESVSNSLASDYKYAEKNLTMADSVSVSGDVSETKAISQTGAYRSEVTTIEDKSKSKATKKSTAKSDNNNQTTVTATATSSAQTTVTVGATGNTAVSDQRYSTAVQKYQNSDYTGSKDLLESYIDDNPNDYNALYYCGVSYYFLNKYADAIPYLEKVTKNKSGSYYEIARWYLALSHINLNENKKAEKILNEMVKDSSSFKVQAGEKLKEINK
jgi:TolA-binding protein